MDLTAWIARMKIVSRLQATRNVKKVCQWCGQEVAVSLDNKTLPHEYICPQCSDKGISYNTVLLDRPCPDPSQHPRNRQRSKRYHA